MKDRRLALRYVRALLSVLSDPAQAAAADSFLCSLRDAMEQSDELRGLLLDPAVPRDQRIAALRGLAQTQGMPKTVGNFLAAVVEHNRTSVLPTIATVFHEEREAAMGIVPAEITTAEPLTEDLKASAREAIQRRTGRKVELTCKVEPELIGGAVTRIGTTVYDGSLRHQLDQLRREMTQE